MRKFLWALSGLLIFSSLSNAGWVGLSSARSMQPSVQIIQSNAKSTIIDIEVPGFESDIVQIDGSEFTALSIPGLSLTDNVGLPEVPRWNRNIAIPRNGKVDVIVHEVRRQTLKLGTLSPSKGTITRDINPKNVPYTFSKFYKSSDTFHSDPVVMGNTFTMRDMSGVNIGFYPISFNPSTSETSVVTKIRFEVKSLSDAPGQVSDVGVMDASFEKMYASAALNSPEFLGESKHWILDTGKVLVIAHPAFVSAMDPWVQWKQQKGWDVKVVTTTETTMDYRNIKDFIKKEYVASKISHVLLVGDAEQVPPHSGKSGNVKGNEADPIYGQLDGNDSYPEVIVSRFAGQNSTDITVQVNKSINYEKTPDVQAEWYSKSTGIASNEGNPTDKARAEILRTMLMKWQYLSVDQFYDPGAKASQVTEAVNAGRGYINYIGHGSITSWVTSGFSNNDISKLNNINKLPFIVSVACVNGQFKGYNSFAEAWMKAGSPEAPKGAIGIFASSTNQSWVPPTVGQKAIAEFLTGNQLNVMGGLYFQGSVAVLEDASDSAAQTFESWHTFGDGTLQVRTSKPTDIKTDFSGASTPGDGLTLNVGEKGISGGLYQAGHLVGRGMSDVNGLLKIDLDSSLDSGAKALLTVTGFNKVPKYFNISFNN